MSQSLDYAPTNRKRLNGWHVALSPAIGCLMLCVFNGAIVSGQTATTQQRPDAPTSADQAQRMAEIEHRLDAVTGALADAEQALQKSLVEIQTLRGQLDTLRAQSASGSEGPESLSAQERPSGTQAASIGVPLDDDLKRPP